MMNFIYKSSFLLLIPAAIFLTSCATDSASTSAVDKSPTTPSIADEPATTTSSAAGTPTSTTPATKSAPTKQGYPYAIKTKWPGIVKSPYAPDKQPIKVEGMAPGSFAECPHTHKIFVVP